MKFKMTYNEAMLIQQGQMAYYRRLIGRKGVKEIRRKTICPIDLDPNEKIFIGTINKYVPRGGNFEYLIYYRPKSSSDPTQSAMHNAIRNSTMYNN